MGIADRDYMRDRRDPGSAWLPPWRWLAWAFVASLVGVVLLLSFRGCESSGHKGRESGMPEGGEPPPRRAAPPEAGRLVNLNTATLEELEALPRVGPKLAQAIRDHRPFERVDDLLRVPGIKERLLERLRSQVTAP